MWRQPPLSGCPTTRPPTSCLERPRHGYEFAQSDGDRCVCAVLPAHRDDAPPAGGSRRSRREPNTASRLQPLAPTTRTSGLRPGAAKPPTWENFGNRTQFTSLANFRLNASGDLAADYVKDLDRYTRQYELGDVLWPYYDFLRAENVGDLVAEIERRHLYVFDIWGYVPGSGPSAQFRAPPAVLHLLDSKLGERWLGMDTGEQDGRYIGLYANLMTPASASRREQYFNFQRFFEGMEDDLGHRLNMLVSLSFGHYCLKQGSHTFVGRRDRSRVAQRPVVLRLYSRRGQAIWRAVVRQCLGLQPLGIQELRNERCPRLPMVISSVPARGPA